MLTGTLIRWNDEKGFGFIHVPSENRDIFIHVSALPHTSRRPVMGDVIFFEIETTEAGKTKAVHAEIVEIPEAPVETPPPSEQATTDGNPRQGKVSSLIPLMVILVLLALSTYKNISSRHHAFSDGQTAQEEMKSRFHCEGKTHCSEMSSCEEAKFYIQHCPNTEEMDGDEDGVPCERQWCKQEALE